MKKWITFVLFALLPSLAFAQNHSATLNWQASATSGVQYNVWRAACSNAPVNGACTEGTFGLITGSPINALTFTDNTVVGGSSYSYYVTAICPATGCPTGISGESAPSNHIAVTIPGTAPSPNPSSTTVVTIIVQ